ncbi:hypothetical protein MUK42_15700, partial [Musa troglodytarum]
MNMQLLLLLPLLPLRLLVDALALTNLSPTTQFLPSAGRGASAGGPSDEGRRREFSTGSDRDEEPRRWILEGMLRRLVLLLGSGRVLLRVGGHAETSTSHDAVVICVTSMFE